MTISKVQHAVSVLWPSFLLASAATIVLFTVFDPQTIAGCMGVEHLERTAAYTVGFFVLWTMNLASSMLTLYFQRPVHVPVIVEPRDLDLD